MLLEVCLEARDEPATVAQVLAARAGGAGTVELCAQMQADGLTPRMECVRAARAALGDWPGLMVMVRPRSGDFLLSPAEVQLMDETIEQAAEAGADGVVFGGVRADPPPADVRAVDIDAMRTLLGTARRRQLVTTFHRAFDAVSDRQRALESLVSLGFDRLLTSGTRWGSRGSAVDGLPVLRQTLAQSAGRIHVVIGGGINAHNVSAIVAGLSHSRLTPPSIDGCVSLHCHSGVLHGGSVDQARVGQLARALA